MVVVRGGGGGGGVVVVVVVALDDLIKLLEPWEKVAPDGGLYDCSAFNANEPTGSKRIGRGFTRVLRWV
jgi:hypothetical protein